MLGTACSTISKQEHQQQLKLISIEQVITVHRYGSRILGCISKQNMESTLWPSEKQAQVWITPITYAITNM